MAVTFLYNNCTYSVIDSNRVILISVESDTNPEATSGGTFTVPSDVAYNSVQYVVTNIGANAFSDAILSQIIIPASVTDISHAFLYPIDQQSYGVGSPNDVLYVVINNDNVTFDGERYLYPESIDPSQYVCPADYPVDDQQFSSHQDTTFVGAQLSTTARMVNYWDLFAHRARIQFNTIATGISLGQASLSLEIGQTASLYASASPSGAYIDPTWTITDNNISYLINGSQITITALAVGTATINVSIYDGLYTDSCTVTITQALIEPTIITDSSISIDVGESANIFVYTDSPGVVSYRIADTSIASLIGNTVTGVSRGTTSAIVSVPAAGNYSAKSVTIPVYVVETASITIPTAYSLTYNGDQQTPIWNNPDNAVLSEPIQPHINAGVYSAIWALPANTSTVHYVWEDSSIGTKQVSWSISKLYNIAIPTAATLNFGYDSSLHYPNWVYDTQKVSIISGGTAQSAVDTYITSFQISSAYAQNYGWIDNTDSIKSIEWQIFSLGTCVLPIQVNTLVYNGTVQYPLWDQYSNLNIENPSSTISAKIPGTYRVDFKPDTYYVWADTLTNEIRSSYWSIEKGEQQILNSDTLVVAVDSLLSTQLLISVSDVSAAPQPCGNISYQYTPNSYFQLDSAGSTFILTGLSQTLSPYMLTVSLSETAYYKPTAFDFFITVVKLGSNFTYKVATLQGIEGLLITGYNRAPQEVGVLLDLTIPETSTVIIDNEEYTYPVIGIDNSAFKNYYFIKSIDIPDSIFYIGYSAFYNCVNLESIIIPSNNKLTSILPETFTGCKSLQSITFSSYITSIGYSAFAGCTSLINVTLPSNITRIENAVFSYCIALSQIIIQSSDIALGKQVFLGCNNPMITIDATNYKFVQQGNCRALVDITDNINKAIFISKTDSINLANNFDSLQIKALDDFVLFDSNLLTLVIPDNITSVGAYACAHSQKLQTLTINNADSTLSKYGIGVFMDCYNLDSTQIVYNPVTPSSLPKDIFRNCKGNY